MEYLYKIKLNKGYRIKMSLFKKIKVTKEGVYLLDPEYRKKFNKLTNEK